MKRFKVLISVITLTFIASVPLAQAQQKKGGMSPEQQIERLEKAVGSLSDEQKSKIKGIIAKTQEQVREQMRDTPKEERNGKRMEMMKEQRMEFRAVLTDEQKAKFDAMGPGRGEGKGGGKKKKQNR